MPIKSDNADFPAPVTPSCNLELSLQRAVAIANQRLQENATLEHLLLALIDDEDAAAVMRAGRVDLDELKRDLTAAIEPEAESPVSDGNLDAKPGPDFQRVIRRAAMHVKLGGRTEITGAGVLVALLDEHESRAAELLREHGMTRYNATRYISHKFAKEAAHAPALATGPEHPSAPAKPLGLLAEVQLLNDDYTPMEFVVQVLERIFGKDVETATRIMLQIHHKGTGTCGIYPCDVAAAMVAEVLDLSRQHQHPLQCVLQESSPAKRCP
jgi:ATP-dependent Clp protease adapter protein ClpS